MIQARNGTQDASVPSAATMVVARSATDIGGGEPHLSELERRKPPTGFQCSARKVARGGLNAEGGIVGGENANWVFE